MFGKRWKRTLLDAFLWCQEDDGSIPWKVFDRKGKMLLGEYCPFIDSSYDNMIVDHYTVRSTYVEVVVKETVPEVMKEKEEFYHGR